MLSPAETVALAPLRAVAAPMLAQVEAWAAINSGSDNLPGLARIADALATAFTPLGGEQALIEGPPSRAVRADGTVADTAHGRHLRQIMRPHAPVQLLLTGHMDTVYAADHPFQTSRFEQPGHLNGPGVADMKGGLAIMLAALSAFEATPAAASLGWTVLIVADEEIGSPSSRPLLAQAAKLAHWGLTYEPSTLPDGTFAGARWGSGNFAAIVTGRSAHAGRNPEEGRNAVTAACDLALRLEAAIGPDCRVNPAKLDGGGPTNVVPAHAVLRFNIRPRTVQAQADAQARIADAIAQVQVAREVAIDLHGGFGRPPKPLDATQQRLFAVVETAARDLGQHFATRDTGGVCDGNNLAAHGLAVVDTLGARGGLIHSPQEYCLTDSLAERAALSTLLLHRLASA
jgi:glutamate carboxypeptidase